MQENKNTMFDEDVFYDGLMNLFQLFKKNWKWFPVSILACLFVAALYLYFTPTTVSVTGKMELIDKSKSGSSGFSAGMALLNSLPMGLYSGFGRGSLGIDSEVEILTSNTLVRSVVKNLGVYTEYRLCKRGRKTLLYQNTPIVVSLDSAHVQWFDDELPLSFHQIQLTVSKNSSGYKVKTKLVENKEETKLSTQTFASLPATIETEVGTLTITENILSPKQGKAFEKDYTLIVTVTPPSTVANSFISRLTIEPPKKTVNNILNITLQDENLLRGLDFVNSLVDAYNQRANNEKNEEARKTDEFVNTRLAKIDVELGSSDDAWENSKKQYQITTPEADAQEALKKRSEYEARLIVIGTNLQMHDYLSEYVNDPANLYEVIPLGFARGASSPSDDGSTTSVSQDYSSVVARHNALVNQRKDLLKSMSELSPQVQRLTKSIEELHPTIQLMMKRDREQLVMQKNTLDREYARYSGRVGSVPQVERVFTEIGRQREIKQAVYLLLLQKREETAMNLANTTDKGRLIDDVSVDSGSNKPHKKMIIVLAVFFGILLPMGVLYLLQLMKSKIDIKEDINKMTKLPYLADIPASDSGEAIRNLRTNLLLNLKTGQNTILVTSQNDGDGKTFIAQHLTDSLNAIGRKTLFINGDMRNSDSQSIQGHPADILASEEFAQQIAQAKADYDFVIIDSPALDKYVDALQLAPFADATLYVAKAGSTLKSDIQALNSEIHLPQPLLVLNN